MLPESAIDGVVDGVQRCHRELIVHGASVILDGLVTANKPPPPPATEPPPQPQASSSPPPSSPSVHQPDVVALDWKASCPWFSGPPTVFHPLLRGKEPWKTTSDFTYVHVDPNQHVTKINAEEGLRPPAADLVVWHRTPRVLELQADTGFTHTGVVNALAREIALNSAKTKLLDYVEEEFTRKEDGYTPRGADDPAVVQFVARFKANVIALVKEASSAPAGSFSVSHPLLPDNVEDRLREKASRNRRENADQQEYQRLSKEYEAAIEARDSHAAGGAPASPAPVGEEMMPEKPEYPSYGAEPVSPDPLAASPPPLVLRPMDDLYRVFSEAEIMVVFSKLILSKNDCSLCPGFEVWFEKKRAVMQDDGVVRHEYSYEVGEGYC